MEVKHVSLQVTVCPQLLEKMNHSLRPDLGSSCIVEEDDTESIVLHWSAHHQSCVVESRVNRAGSGHTQARLGLELLCRSIFPRLEQRYERRYSQCVYLVVIGWVTRLELQVSFDTIRSGNTLIQYHLRW